MHSHSRGRLAALSATGLVVLAAALGVPALASPGDPSPSPEAVTPPATPDSPTPAAGSAPASPAPGSATPSAAASLPPSEMPVPCIVTEQQVVEHFPGAEPHRDGSRTLWYRGDELVAAPHAGVLKSKACLPR